MCCVAGLDDEGHAAGDDQAGHVDEQLHEGATDLVPLAVGGCGTDVADRRDRGDRDEDADQRAAARFGQRQHPDDTGKHGDHGGQHVGAGR